MSFQTYDRFPSTLHNTTTWPSDEINSQYYSFPSPSSFLLVFCCFWCFLLLYCWLFCCFSTERKMAQKERNRAVYGPGAQKYFHVDVIVLIKTETSDPFLALSLLVTSCQSELCLMVAGLPNSTTAMSVLLSNGSIWCVIQNVRHHLDLWLHSCPVAVMALDKLKLAILPAFSVVLSDTVAVIKAVFRPIRHESFQYFGILDHHLRLGSDFSSPSASWATPLKFI